MDSTNKSIDVLMPLKSQEEVTQSFLRQKRRWTFNNRINIERVSLVYKPFYIIEFQYDVKIGRKVLSEITNIIMDTENSVIGIIKDEIVLTQISRESVGEDVIAPNISADESVKTGEDFLYKKVYKEYRVFPENTNYKIKLIYRGNYVFFYEGMKTPGILPADPYQLD